MKAAKYLQWWITYLMQFARLCKLIVTEHWNKWKSSASMFSLSRERDIVILMWKMICVETTCCHKLIYCAKNMNPVIVHFSFLDSTALCLELIPWQRVSLQNRSIQLSDPFYIPSMMDMKMMSCFWRLELFEVLKCLEIIIKNVMFHQKSRISFFLVLFLV